MTKDQLFGVVRTLAAAIGGFLAGQGFIEAANIEIVAGAVATLAVAAWSVASKKPQV